MQPSGSDTTIPQFIVNLWRMVNNPEIDDLIYWCGEGNTFALRNNAHDWQILLSQYYKHNQMSSFIRQLNMYGFHKVNVKVTDSYDCKDDKNEFQFMHPFFRKEHPELLLKIKRKSTNSKIITTDSKIVTDGTSKDELSSVLSDVKNLQNRQQGVTKLLRELQSENTILWREMAMMRQKHQKLQSIINKLIQFIVSLVQPPTRMNSLGLKRHYPLMIKDATPSKVSKMDEQVSIQELDSPTTLLDEDLLKATDFEMNNFASTSQNDPDQVLPNEDDSVGNSMVEFLNGDNIDTVLSNEPSISNVLLQEQNEEVKNESLDEDQKLDIPTSDMTMDDLLASNLSEFVKLPENFDSPESYLYSNDAPFSPQLENQLVNDSIENGNDCDSMLLNPSSGNVILNSPFSSTLKIPSANIQTPSSTENLTVATMPQKEQLYNHLAMTESDINHLKELLISNGSIDSSVILNLFNDDSTFGISFNQDAERLNETTDLLSELSEMAGYESNPDT